MTFTDSQPATLGSNIITFIKFIFFFALGILIIWLSLRNLTPNEKNEIIKSFKTANYYWVILVIILGIVQPSFT